MPLDATIRNAVNAYTLNALAPSHWKGKPFAWFEGQFSFISDDALRRHLAEALYQARWIERLREALGLFGGFNNMFVKLQILLFASIYEAIIDHVLALNISRPELQAALSADTYVPAHDALSKNTALSYNGEPLVVCRRKTRSRQLRDLQFSDRVALAKNLGFVSASQIDMITELYTSRNRIHLGAAAITDFRPRTLQAADALKGLTPFLKAVAARLGNAA